MTSGASCVRFSHLHLSDPVSDLLLVTFRRRSAHGRRGVCSQRLQPAGQGGRWPAVTLPDLQEALTLLQPPLQLLAERAPPAGSQTDAPIDPLTKAVTHLRLTCLSLCPLARRGGRRRRG